MGLARSPLLRVLVVVAEHAPAASPAPATMRTSGQLIRVRDAHLAPLDGQHFRGLFAHRIRVSVKRRPDYSMTKVPGAITTRSSGL